MIHMHWIQRKMSTCLLTLIIIASFVITAQSYRVFIMEQRFQQIIREFRQEEDVTNEQEKEKNPQLHKPINEQNNEEKQGGQDRVNEISKNNLKNNSMVSNRIKHEDTKKGQSDLNAQIESSITSKESGHAINCAVNFQNGKVRADVFAAGMTTPILHYVKTVSCRMLELMFTGVCQKGKISKNDHIQASQIYKMYGITTHDDMLLPMATLVITFNIFKIERGLMGQTGSTSVIYIPVI
ncbi:hypothetical protein KUTeg_019542 [Tegillarca granosa]|uniref:Uncharacterized protein n=1 Tax=Tegillarca granosa TaxID=220873 RepID=A0ABQ9EH18_TEGGR|nr:hypothetical protein KUTeg_019542 [Tegillarca granosa]